MKVSMNWLRRYTDIPVSDAEYESRMVMAGNGVEGMEKLGAELEGVVVGRVLTCESHPNSDHLHVCTVDTGDAEPWQIVCGAPNVEAGILVPVAKIGAKLPGGIKIKKTSLRGVESSGMLCSSEEIGVPVDLYPSVGSAGLLIFREEYPLGQDVKEIFGLNDTVADFEILANRPDCLSVWGMARETAAVFGTELRLPEVTAAEADGDIHDYVSIDVRDAELCPRYAARVIKNVRIGPSPMWMRQYLHAAGMRSINNIVDITNFIMLETGHPMHAFDLEKVRGGKIIVRRTVDGEKLTTLDGREYTLTGKELAICDAERPTGLAGIMGGEESEIAEGTHTVLFECASFDRTGIRLTTRRLGFRTEASGHFERGVSPKTVLTALNRACRMVNELDAGDVVPGVIDFYPNPTQNAVIEAPVDYINRRTGVVLSGEEMQSILEKLYFDVTLKDGVLYVKAPEFRQDVEGKADIAEEVLRLAGYERIPSTRLKGETTSGGRNARLTRHGLVQTLLTGLGFYETMTYSFISAKSIELLGIPADDARRHPIMIRNPLGEDTAALRTTLLCGLCQTTGTNQRAGNAQGRIYEIGKCYDGKQKTAEGLPVEHDTLALSVWGAGEDFYSLRGVAETLLGQVGADYTITDAQEAFLHPGRRARLVSREHPEQVFCTLGQIHPDTAQRLEVQEKTYVCEMDLDAVFALAEPMGHVTQIARFPAVERDLALVMDESVQLGPLMDAMRRACGKTLEDIRLFDVFRGIQVGPGRKSAAFGLHFRAQDHTLTEEEITKLTEKALKAAEAHCGAVLRA